MSDKLKCYGHTILTVDELKKMTPKRIGSFTRMVAEAKKRNGMKIIFDQIEQKLVLGNLITKGECSVEMSERELMVAGVEITDTIHEICSAYNDHNTGLSVGFSNFKNCGNQYYESIPMVGFKFFLKS